MVSLADLLAIKKALKAWVDLETGDQCIPAEDNGPKPAKPFFTYRLDSFIDEGEDYIGPPNSLTGDVLIRGNRAFTVGIQGYGPGVLEKLNDLKNSTRKLTVLETFQDSGIVIFNRLAIQNLTGLDQTEYEERGLFEMLMRTDSEVIDTGSIIEDVHAFGTIKNPPRPDRIMDLDVITP